MGTAVASRSILTADRFLANHDARCLFNASCFMSISVRRSLPAISFRLYSCRPSSDSVFPEDHFELHHSFQSQGKPVKPTSVFVALPADSVDLSGQVKRTKALRASFMALAAAGVEGVVVEVWWGIVERDGPRIYDWRPYFYVIELAAQCGLKVRTTMAFRQFISDPEDYFSIPLPRWVLEEMDKNPDLAYSDRLGRRNCDCISMGCDVLPLLKGRSPIQVYSDFMREFKDTFSKYLGAIITDIQVGMGPGGELNYPLNAFDNLASAMPVDEFGNYECFDRYLLASLNACMQQGACEFDGGGTRDDGSLIENPEQSSFQSDGPLSIPCCKILLVWYSRMLLAHCERLCIAADAIFWGTGVKLSAKVALVHWQNGGTCPSQFSAGYYNVATDGFLPIILLFAKYRMTLCCSFDSREMANSLKKNNPKVLLLQLMFAASEHGLSITGENSLARLDESFKQRLIKTSKLFYDGVRQSLSFNFVRMNKHLFEKHNWTSFTWLVRQISDSRTFQAKLNSRASEFHVAHLEDCEIGAEAFAYF